MELVFPFIEAYLLRALNSPDKLKHVSLLIFIALCYSNNSKVLCVTEVTYS
jgi:hypothetical protein